MGVHPDDMPLLSYGDSIPEDGVCRHLDKFSLGACKHWPDDFVSRQLTEGGWWGDVGDNATFENLKRRPAKSTNAEAMRNNFLWWEMNTCNDMEPAFGQKGYMFRASFVEGEPPVGKPNVYWVYDHQYYIVWITFYANQTNSPGNISFGVAEKYIGGNVTAGAGVWGEGAGVPYTTGGLTCPHGHSLFTGIAYKRSGYTGLWMFNGASHSFPDELWPRCSILTPPHFCLYTTGYSGSRAWCGEFPMAPLSITFDNYQGFSYWKQTCDSFLAGDPPPIAIPALLASGEYYQITACALRDRLIAHGDAVPEDIIEDCEKETEGGVCA